MALRTAFPDIHYSIDDAIMCGDQIVHRLTATGTMTGELNGIPPPASEPRGRRSTSVAASTAD